MILIAIIFIGGAFVFAEYRNREGETIYTKENTSVSTTSNKIDLNNTDWKKILLANETNASSSIQDLTKKAEKLTPADMLARDFFSRYMELRQLGAVDDKASQQDLIDNVLQNSIIIASSKVYNYKDIKINTNYTKEDLRAYGNEVGKIFKTYSVPSRNEAEIVKDAFDKGDMKILAELDPIIKSNRNTLNALIKISIPEPFSRTHINLINILSSVLFTNESFKKSENDPFAGIQAISLYIKNYEDTIVIVNDISSIFISNGILYKPSEDGSIFTQI